MSMMGNLAALDDYDPNAEFPPLPVDDAFAAAAARTAGPYRAVQQRAGTSPLQNAPSAVIGALAAPFAQTNQLIAKNPYPEGSEEASFYEDQRLKNSASFGEKTALGLLGVGAPMAMTGVVPGGAVAGMFGGKLAETADLAALRRAQRLEKAGTEPGAVLDTTGWEKRPDKQWRFEINDRDSAMQPAPFAHMRMNEPLPGNRPDVVASDVFNHPELYAAYPEIANMPVRRLPAVDSFGRENNIRGGYAPDQKAFYLRENLSPEEARTVLLHEMQHAVQGVERFAEGGNISAPAVVKRGDRQLEQTISAAEQRFNTLRDRMLSEVTAQTPSGNPSRAQIEQWKKDNPVAAVEMDRAFDTFSAPGGATRNQSRYEAYRALQGETEARNVAARADLIPAQRYLLRPEVTEDVARSQQWVNRDKRPKKMGDVAAQDMMLDAGPPPRAAVGSLFDYSKIHDVPDVKQFDLRRYEPKHGVSERVQDLVKNKRVERQMLEKIEEGKNIGAGAETFYYNEPMREAFVAELGKKQGGKDFARYMDYVAGSSPRSDIEANARNASFYYGLEKRGEQLPGKNPFPYGHMAQALHRGNAEKIRSGEYFDIVKNPKPLSFSQNLQGNFAPVTVDAHAVKLPAMLARDPRFLAQAIKLEKDVPTINPTTMFERGDLSMKEALQRPVYWAAKPKANEYAAMENYYKRLAAEAGLTPAQAQAAAWAAGGPMTGLKSVAGDPFMRAVENRANITAAKRGISPAEALSRMIRGKEPLLAAPPIAAMGTIAAQDAYDQ